MVYDRRSSYSSHPSVGSGIIRAGFGLSNGTPNQYRLLAPEDPLDPCKVYWIKISVPTSLTVD